LRSLFPLLPTNRAVCSFGSKNHTVISSPFCSWAISSGVGGRQWQPSGGLVYQHQLLKWLAHGCLLCRGHHSKSS
jgi:hypothetical protein